jgi:hypothetical protein
MWSFQVLIVFGTVLDLLLSPFWPNWGGAIILYTIIATLAFPETYDRIDLLVEDIWRNCEDLSDLCVITFYHARSAKNYILSNLVKAFQTTCAVARLVRQDIPGALVALFSHRLFIMLSPWIVCALLMFANMLGLW